MGIILFYNFYYLISYSKVADILKVFFNVLFYIFEETALLYFPFTLISKNVKALNERCFKSFIFIYLVSSHLVNNIT